MGVGDAGLGQEELKTSSAGLGSQGRGAGSISSSEAKSTKGVASMLG